jgi:hypothetical protein
LNSKRPASAGRFCFLGSAPGSGAGFGGSPKWSFCFNDEPAFAKASAAKRTRMKALG